MRTALRCIVALVFGSAVAGGAAAADRIAYVHTPAVAAAVMTADRDACIKDTLAWINGPSSPALPLHNASTNQTIAHAFDLRGPKLAAAHEVRCMAQRGYVALPLTDAERKSLGKARDAAARDRWYGAFAAQDLTARITAVPPPAE